MFSRDDHVRNIVIYVHFFEFAEFIPHVNGHRLVHDLHRCVFVLCFKIYLPFLVMNRIKGRWRENFKAMTPTCGHVTNLREDKMLYIRFFKVNSTNNLKYRVFYI